MLSIEDLSDQPSVQTTVHDFAQCSPASLKIIHVGAGASGIQFAHKAQKLLRNFELTIYEKNTVAGGTWYENRYPGCACDVPAHTYTFPSEPNPELSGFYSGAAEIQEYMLRTAAKWGLDKFTRYGTKVLSTKWCQEESLWTVFLKNLKGREYTDRCNVPVNGAGVVNNWKWPAIEGLHDVRGSLLHTANWGTSADWTNKRVAVIGSGSSSIQLVPQLGKTAQHLTVFIRNQTYVGPTMSFSLKLDDVDPKSQDPAITNFHKYTEREKQKFRDDPQFLLEYRKMIEQGANAGFPILFEAHHKTLDLNNYGSKE